MMENLDDLDLTQPVDLVMEKVREVSAPDLMSKEVAAAFYDVLVDLIETERAALGVE